MDSNSFEPLKMAVVGIIVVFVVGMAFFLFRQASSNLSTVTGKVTQMTAEMAEADVSMYDGTTVTGSEVINAINRYKSEEMGVIVTTKNNVVAYYNRKIEGGSLKGSSGCSSLRTAQIKSENNYINPTGKFEGTIRKNSNDAIIGISFQQK